MSTRRWSLLVPLGIATLVLCASAGCGGVEEEDAPRNVQAVEQAMIGVCGIQCENKCRLTFYYCSDKCDAFLNRAKCDMACVQAQVQCQQACQCKEECINDGDCAPGRVCAGTPGSRRCLIPPDPLVGPLPAK
jgi:hypothetical protein